MPLKTHKLCDVCKAIKRDRNLTDDIYHTKAFLKTDPNALSLKDFWRKHQDKFSYHSLMKHCQKHQYLSGADLNERHLRQIAQKAEKEILKREIQSKQVWDEVIGRGMDSLASNKMNINAGHLLKAAKDKSDFEMKQTDQQLAMMDMVFHFASGEGDVLEQSGRTPIEGQVVNQEGETDAEHREASQAVTDPVASDSTAREARSRSFYERIARSATAPGTD